MLPSAMYVGVHWNSLRQPTHAWSVLLLLSGPLLTVLSAPGGLWWTPLHVRAAEWLRWTSALLCLAALVAGLEVRSVFNPIFNYCLAR